MVFKTTIMKKTYTILLVLFTLLSNAQTLEYNRVIDTVLSITIPSGVNMNTSGLSGITYGDFTSPPNGKVWKVESITVNAPKIFETMVMYCVGSQYTSNWGTYLRIQAVIRDESITNSLYESAPSIQTGSGNYLNSPLWINNAELGIAFRSLVAEDVCLTQPYTGYVFLSIIEFNE